MHVLAVQHVSIEGLGLFEALLKEFGAQTTVVDVSIGDQLPLDPKDFQAVISLGGPMNVYEEEKYPFLKCENTFIQNILEAEIPFLGICLGSQLLAKAAGACVQKAPFEEIGLYDVWLTVEGRQDPLFAGIQTPFKVFQWHEDMFGIPAQKGVCLAGSDMCPHQACRIGQNAYGLQFHVEVTQDMIISWMQEYWKIKNVYDHEDSRKVLEEYARAQKGLYNVATKIFTNFLSLIR